MEMSNQNLIEIPPVAVPLVSEYEDSEYKWCDYIEQPPLYDNCIPWEESSYNNVGPAINHLNGYEQFYHGCQPPEYNTFYHADVAYPYPDPSRYMHNIGCDCSLCHGANTQGTYPETDLSQSNIYDAPYRGSEKSSSAIKPIGWERERNRLACEGNVESDDREIPSEEKYSDQENEYKNRYDSEPAWEVASLSRALESTYIEWGEDHGETQWGETVSPDTKPGSSVETENHKESTPKKVAKEKKKKKAKSSRSRERRFKKHPTPIYHIKWDWEGFGEQEIETVGQVCQLCEEELSIPQEQQHEYGDYEYYELINQPQNYQEVSVLPCGHAFHSSCLDQATPEELIREPICFLCLSCES